MSIRFKLTILAIVSFCLIVTASVYIYYQNSQKNKELVISKYKVAIKELMPLIVDEINLDKKLKELNLIKSTKSTKKAIYTLPITFGKIKVTSDYKLYINYLDKSIWLYDNSLDFIKVENRLFLLFVSILFLIVGAILFVAFRILKPLTTISQAISSYQDNNFKLRLGSFKDKELSDIATGFNKMATKIEEDMKQKDEFLRYIGHELKTPLAKIKFAIEKRDFKTINQSTNEIDEYIKQLLFLEFIKTKELKKDRFSINELIVASLNMLSLDEDRVDIKISKNFEIVGDLETLKVALKNLIDNAYKYATSYPIKILVEENEIKVVNYGTKIENFNTLLIPFKHKSHKGHGVGVSIVNMIVQKHKFKFDYEYRNGLNIFSIKFV